MNDSLTKEQRQRLLEHGRKLLEAKKRQAMTPEGTSARSTVSSGVMSAGPLLSRSAAPADSGEGQAVSTPAACVASSPATLERRQLFSDGQSNGLATPTAAPSISQPKYSPTPITVRQDTRDVEHFKKLDQLTVEKSQLQAKLFQKERDMSALEAMNRQLQEKVASGDVLAKENEQLQRQIRELESQKQVLNDACRTRVDERDTERAELLLAQEQLSGKLQEERAVVQDLTEKVDALEETKLRLEERLTSMADTLQQALDEKKHVEMDVIRRQEKIELAVAQTKSVREEYETRIQELQAQMTRQQESVKEKEAQIGVLAQEIEQRDRARKADERFLNQRSQEEQRINEELAMVAAERDALRINVTQQTATIDRLTETVTRQQEQLKSMEEQSSKRMQQKQEKVLESSNTIRELLDNKVATVQKMQEKIEQLEAENRVQSQLLETMQEAAALYESEKAQFKEAENNYQKRETEAVRKVQMDLEQAQSNVRRLERDNRSLRESHDLAVHCANDKDALLQQWQTELKQLEQFRLRQQTDEWALENMGEAVSKDNVVILQEARIMQLLEELEFLSNQLHERPSVLVELRMQNLELQQTQEKQTVALQNLFAMISEVSLQLNAEVARSKGLSRRATELLTAIENNTGSALATMLKSEAALEEQREGEAVTAKSEEILAALTTRLGGDLWKSAARRLASSAIPEASTGQSASATEPVASEEAVKPQPKESSSWLYYVPIVGRFV